MVESANGDELRGSAAVQSEPLGLVEHIRGDENLHDGNHLKEQLKADVKEDEGNVMGDVIVDEDQGGLKGDIMMEEEQGRLKADMNEYLGVVQERLDQVHGNVKFDLNGDMIADDSEPVTEGDSKLDHVMNASSGYNQQVHDNEQADRNQQVYKNRQESNHENHQHDKTQQRADDVVSTSPSRPSPRYQVGGLVFPTPRYSIGDGRIVYAHGTPVEFDAGKGKKVTVLRATCQACGKRESPARPRRSSYKKDHTAESAEGGKVTKRNAIKSWPSVRKSGDKKRHGGDKKRSSGDKKRSSGDKKKKSSGDKKRSSGNNQNDPQSDTESSSSAQSSGYQSNDYFTCFHCRDRVSDWKPNPVSNFLQTSRKTQAELKKSKGRTSAPGKIILGKYLAVGLVVSDRDPGADSKARIEHVIRIGDNTVEKPKIYKRLTGGVSNDNYFSEATCLKYIQSLPKEETVKWTHEVCEVAFPNQVDKNGVLSGETVMEYIEENRAKVLRDDADSGKKAKLTTDSLPKIKQKCEAELKSMKTMHDQSILHFDIKNGNIVNGRLLDFGHANAPCLVEIAVEKKEMQPSAEIDTLRSLIDEKIEEKLGVIVVRDEGLPELQIRKEGSHGPPDGPPEAKRSRAEFSIPQQEEFLKENIRGSVEKSTTIIRKNNPEARMLRYARDNTDNRFAQGEKQRKSAVELQKINKIISGSAEYDIYQLVFRSKEWGNDLGTAGYRSPEMIYNTIVNEVDDEDLEMPL